jgi:hypothetical protein
MSEKKEAPVEEKSPIVTPEQVVVAEAMIRDESKLSCASNTSKCCKCSWSLFLNSIEALCSGLSICCIGMSDAAIGCKKCLEQADCDGH